MTCLTLQPFVPSGADFEKARQFFVVLGFTELWDAGDYVGFENNGCRFILQRYAERGFAENFMLTVNIPSADEFRAEVLGKGLPEKFGIRISGIAQMPYGREVNIIDTAGVCWHFVQS